MGGDALKQSGSSMPASGQLSVGTSLPALCHAPECRSSFRGWFSQAPSTAIPGPDFVSMDPAGGDRDRVAAEKWSFFGPKSVQKPSCDPGMPLLGGASPFGSCWKADESTRWGRHRGLGWLHSLASCLPSCGVLPAVH